MAAWDTSGTERWVRSWGRGRSMAPWGGQRTCWDL